MKIFFLQKVADQVHSLKLCALEDFPDLSFRGCSTVAVSFQRICQAESLNDPGKGIVATNRHD